MGLAKDLSILFIFSKNQLSIPLIFAIIFSVSISFVSALIFVIYFFPLTLGFVCFSLIALGVRLCCLFGIFLLLEVRLMAINFLIRTAFTASHRFWTIMLLLAFISRYVFNVLLDLFSDSLVTYIV